MKVRQRGLQLLEITVSLAVVAILSLLVVPPLIRATAALRVELAAYELAGVLRRARADAIRFSANVALKFRTLDDGEVTYTLYRDGDGDGVLNADLETGTDPQIGPSRRLAHFGRRVGFGFPAGPPPTDPGDPRRRLKRLDDPIRFNRSDLASFSSLGTSTPGSLYLTDGRRNLAVVRVFHRTGKVKVLRYDPESERWR
jgi:type II secretory pathway pseudopilin PulG